MKTAQNKRDTLEERLAYNDGYRTSLTVLLRVLDKSESIRWWHRPGVNLVRKLIVKTIEKSYDRAGQSHLKGETLA